MSEQPQPLPLVPRVYANGLGIAHSKTESVVTFIFAGDPLVSVILPFAIAKVLRDQLTVLVNEYENSSGQKILDLLVDKGSATGETNPQTPTG
jgi:hypothetical protein